MIRALLRLALSSTTLALFAIIGVILAWRG